MTPEKIAKFYQKLRLEGVERKEAATATLDHFEKEGGSFLVILNALLPVLNAER